MKPELTWRGGTLRWVETMSSYAGSLPPHNIVGVYVNKLPRNMWNAVFLLGRLNIHTEKFSDPQEALVALDENVSKYFKTHEDRAKEARELMYLLQTILGVKDAEFTVYKGKKYVRVR